MAMINCYLSDEDYTFLKSLEYKHGKTVDEMVESIISEAVIDIKRRDKTLMENKSKR